MDIHFMFCADGRTNKLKVLVKAQRLIFQVIRDLGVYDMTTEQLTTLDRKQSVKMVEFNFLLKQTKKIQLELLLIFVEIYEKC